MKRHLLFAAFVLFSALGYANISLYSPDKQLNLTFKVSEDGEPVYALSYKNKPVIKESKMGFHIQWSTPLAHDFTIVDATQNSVDHTWETVWGENRFIRNHYNELVVKLKQKETNRILLITFRLFNDGLGFRYDFPMQDNLLHFIIQEEITQFNLTGDHTAFWLPGDYDTNEYPTTISKLSEINQLIDKVREEPLAAKSFTPNLAIQTPLLLKSDNGLYINIHEAALVNFAAMQLNVDDLNFQLSAHLVPDFRGNKVYAQTGDRSPWRTIIVSDDARDILASNLILNLNEPCKIEDFSWIKPMKYIGVWWEYFTGGGSSWSYTKHQGIRIGETDYSKLTPSGKHGATTENVKYHIDFAAKHGFDAVLVEGWNEGWEDNVAFVKDEIYNFTKPYPDFDVKKLRQYASEKGIVLIMHHETTSAVISYERQLDTAFRFMVTHGYPAVKTGYVGPIIPRSEHHDGQWMVNHYNRVIEKAAEYKIMVNSHESVRPTGLCRTYPNWLAAESARGTEFESFRGNHPNHTTILPFTRLVGGPMDYTPGIFEGDLSIYGSNPAKLSSTLVKQLALYVIMYSPLQMAADLPVNYEKHPDAFQFIKDVAVDWDTTCILEAEPGDFITIARKARGKDEWFIGSITDEHARETVISFSFLKPGKQYELTLYADGDNAHWQDNPKSYSVKNMKITSKTKLKQKIAAGGGMSARIR
ncbi:glycoside hydrolase family 97 protein [Bacteroidales bacterium OttesenSCG-928-B11]|nr:glycoside hydrolase family 97 protein [Bacteroidales bacterium OttesenSCG-928-B11]MDL2326051.1 glycoside hydrolase family 97 protein [Bacteroidales bacterium OttesenSCG-928-A14]